MNQVSLVGRLTRDPEVRYSADLAIARFSIAIDRPVRREGNHETDYPSIVVFGKQAENCEKYIGKGSLVAIEGRLQTGSYEKDGRKVYTTDVVANRVEFLDRRQAAGQAPAGYAQGAGFNAPEGAAPQQAAQQAPANNIPIGFEEIDDDDIPF